MWLTALELENFKSYEKARISFQRGTQAIIGENGAGKSSLLEAIGFALFGAQPSGLSLARILREGANRGRVVVQFESSVDKRLYEVERCFSSKGTTRFRVYDVEMGRMTLADGRQDVLDWLAQHLGIESDRLTEVFHHAIGVPQGMMTAPFLDSEKDRRSRFDGLLRVDEFEDAWKNLGETVRYLKDQVVELEWQVARLQGRLEALPALEAQYESYDAQARELAQQCTAQEASLASACESLGEMDAAQERLRAAEQQFERLSAELAYQQERLKEAQRSLLEAERARERMRQAELGYRAYSEISEQLEGLEARRAERDRCQRALAEARQRLAVTETRLEQAHRALREIDDASREIEQIEPQVERHRRLVAEREQLLQRVSLLATLRQQADALAEEMVARQHRLEEQRRALEEGRALEADLTRLQDEWLGCEEQLQEKQQALGQCRAEHQRLQEQVSALEQATGARCPVCEAELTEAHRQELLARNARLLGKLSRQERRIAQELGELRAQREALQQQRAHLEARLRDLPREQDVAHAAQALDEARQQLDAMRQKIATLERDAKHEAALREELDALDAVLQRYHQLLALAAQRAEREEEVQRLERELAHLQQKRDELEEELGHFGDLDGQIDALRAEQARHRPDYENYIAHARLAQELSRRQEHLETVASHLEALTKEAEERRDNLETLRAAYDAEEHAALRQRVRSLELELATLDTRRRDVQTRLSELKTEIAALRDAEKTLQARQGELGRLQATVDLVQWLRDLLREAGQHVVRELVRRISESAAMTYAELMGTATGRLQWDESYALTLEVRGETRDFAQLSGGEQMCAALALRLALLRHISAVDIAFFDEPTAHLDPERRRGLAEKIMQVRGLSQLFVISHDDTFEQAAQSYLNVYKENGVSRVEVP